MARNETSRCGDGRRHDPLSQSIRRENSSRAFREVQGLWMSSIGLGTYLGNYDDATDQQYHRAVVRAVESGCNVIDSAINYRLQRSERSIGTALKELSTKGYNRDEIVIATKGGFIPYDGTPPKDAKKYIEETFIKSGLVDRGRSSSAVATA